MADLTELASKLQADKDDVLHHMVPLSPLAINREHLTELFVLALARNDRTVPATQVVSYAQEIATLLRPNG